MVLSALRQLAQWGVQGLTPRPQKLIWSSLTLLALAGCSKDSGTNSQPPTRTATALVIVSGDGQTGTVNQELAAAIVVQVNDQSGSPMANVAVGFAVTLGGGLAAASVTTGSDGRASTNWLLGTTAGANTVTATVTSTPSLTGIFNATGTADVPVLLATSSPFNQIGPKGGTLPTPFVVTLEDLFGNGVEGETVEFVVAPGNGSVNPTMAVTDASGQASTIWTLEDVLGVQILDVQIPALAAIVPILFSVDAVTLFLSTVSPDPLVEGQAATLTGTGFDLTPANNAVTMDGVATTVTMATATQLDVTVPAFECKPARDVDVKVTVAAVTTNTVAHAAEPASFVSVGVGQQQLITDPVSFCLQFAASASSEAYLIGVQSVSEVASGLTDVQLVAAKDPAAPAPPPAPLARLTTQGSSQNLVITDRMRRWSAHREAHAGFLDRQRASLSGLSAGRPMASGPAAIPTDVMVDDMLAINVPDFDGNTCLNPTAITAVVKHIGTKGVWLEDVDNPAGGFSAADYKSLSDQLDDPIYDTDVAEFGVPTDLDGDGKIGIVVTQEVNKISASILGFVSGSDLSPVASCPASNEAELYYGKAPDPAGDVGAAYSLADALADAPPLIAHEFVHIIQQGVRMTAGAPFLSTWETEGQATLGEEVVGHAIELNSAGNNYDNTVAFGAGGVSGIKWYEASFLDMAQYFGWDSNVMGGMTKVSDAPEQCTWLDSNAVSDGSDPDRPCVGGRQPYGVPWSFLRWLNDHFAANFAGGEQDLQRAIVSGSSSGYANISAVIGEPISTLLAQWAAALYVDDRVGGAATRLTMTSWDLFDVFETGLTSGLWLTPTAVSFADFTQTFKVRGASTGYFRISGTTRPATAVRARDLADGELPSSMQLWVVRLQ